MPTLRHALAGRRRMAEGRRGSLALRRRALPSPPPCRFIPALSQSPHGRAAACRWPRPRRAGWPPPRPRSAPGPATAAATHGGTAATPSGSRPGARERPRCRFPSGPAVRAAPCSLVLLLYEERLGARRWHGLVGYPPVPEEHHPVGPRGQLGVVGHHHGRPAPPA